MTGERDMESATRWAIYEADDTVFMSWYINYRNTPGLAFQDRCYAEERYDKIQQQRPPELRRAALGFSIKAMTKR